MRFFFHEIWWAILGTAIAASPTPGTTRPPLSYAPIPQDVYTAPVRDNVTTLLKLIESKPELTMLREALEEPAGFVQAFDTEATWDFTFFAPSNTAFENLGTYWQTFAATPKGKWWMGNQLKTHYVPNSILDSNSFNSTPARVQTSTYLWLSAQMVSGRLLLNQVATVTEADIPVTNGVVHVIDRVLDPSAQVFNADIAEADQAFIPGSCTNPDLPYC